MLREFYSKYFWILAVFISGGAILIIEILGTRILAPLYGTTIYVWSGLITVALFSLAVGYFSGGKLADKKNDKLWFYALFVLTGLLLILVLEMRGSILIFSENFGALYGPLVAAFLLFSLPLWVLGMVDPFAVRLHTKRIKTVGSSTGYVLGVATAGGLIGSLTSAYILLPRFTLTVIFLCLALVLLFVGVAGIALEILIFKRLRKENYVKYKNKASMTVIILTAILLLITLAYHGNDLVLRHSTRFATAQILYENQNVYGLNRAIAIPRLEDGLKCFTTDSALQTCIDPNNKDTVSYTGKMGLFIDRLPPGSNMLLLGLGGGKIINDWYRDDISIDIVDINPATFEATEKYLGVPYYDNHTKYVMDARRFLRDTENAYDLILIDVATTLSPPAHLFTKEFFSLVSESLSTTGVAVMLLHESDPSSSLSFRSLMKTIQSVMNNTSGSHDGITYLLTMSASNTDSQLSIINSDIKTIQDKISSPDNFSTFTKIANYTNDREAHTITDERNMIELLWQDNISLFQRFNLLLKDDVR